MATISTVLRNFREPTREELNRIFFALPPDDSESVANGSASSKNLKAAEKGGADAKENEKKKAPEERGEMEINAVLSLGEEGIEDSYVRTQSFLYFYILQIED